ncbi:helix-turn-helix domain-containing protein [Cupriavidus sp. CuC1]|uniref:helix-turn-helix domain-containing protein n=1 Tax=Cupriavidus sp. CuC1 TaxID=3373131 RepID=UPI0037D730D5
MEINLTTWPTVHEQALAEPQRANFLARVRAVRLYLNGADGKEIQAKAGISRGQVYRLITERCLAPHPDGRIYGWRGLLPLQRIRPYTRTAPLVVNPWGGGAAGALQALFQSAAGLEAEFRQQIPYIEAFFPCLAAGGFHRLATHHRKLTGPETGHQPGAESDGHPFPARVCAGVAGHADR